MRILHVIANIAPRLGGPSKVVLEMSAALAAHGHVVEIITTTLQDRGSWFPRRVRAERLELQGGRRLVRAGYWVTCCRPSWPTRWGCSLEMVGVLRQRIPTADVVHIHSLYLFHTLVASRLAQRFEVPYIVRPHGTLDPYIRRRHHALKAGYHALLENRTLRSAAAIHFTTEEERELAKPALPRGVRTCVIPLGVDVEQYTNLPDRTTARLSFGLPGDAVVCLFHGRLNHKKGLDILAPAFVKLCDEVPQAWLLLAGPDDDGLGKRFLEECQGAGVRSRVVATGMLDPTRVKAALAAADLWVLPSYSENFGVAAAEAMAAGLPVVITKKVNIWPMVHSVGAGVVTAPELGPFFAGMVDVASRTTDARKAMGERGRMLCEREFAWWRVSEELEQLYSAIRGKTRTGPTCT